MLYKYSCITDVTHPQLNMVSHVVKPSNKDVLSTHLCVEEPVLKPTGELLRVGLCGVTNTERVGGGRGGGEGERGREGERGEGERE